MIDLGALLKTFIYLISSSLLYPVLLLLVVLTLVIIVHGGSFFAEWLSRIRLKGASALELPALLKAGACKDVVSHRVNRYLRDLKQARTKDDDTDTIVENLLQETSLRLWKSMDRLRILVRAAPSLGLIGTLIPMGTGLAALGQGDMTKLTTDLVIAFNDDGCRPGHRYPGFFHLHDQATLDRRGCQKHGAGHRADHERPKTRRV